MSNEELDSQLSAMFDDELPATECELLARRLARDEQLRARWGHYAAIGACIRGEPGVRLETTLASKVSAALKQEAIPSGMPATGRQKPGFLNPWLTSLGGLASAAAVAAVAILWMRAAGPSGTVTVARVAAPMAAPIAAPVIAAPVSTAPQPPAQPVQIAAHRRPAREPDSYVTPAAAPQGPVLVQPTELANYIVAHSAYSGPLMRRNALSALVGGDAAPPQPSVQPVSVTVVTGK
jgi:negative regulator of sigma E activity